MSYRYFDWAATSPISESALKRYNEVATTYPGNPSSAHQLGRSAHMVLESSRQEIAELLAVGSETVTFTSGGSEANAIALLSLLWRPQRGRVILSALEHSSIAQYQHFLTQAGFEVIYVPAPHGRLDIEQFAEALNDETLFVAVMLVNNVLGTVQEVGEISTLLRDHENRGHRPVHLHCDAIQAPGKLDFSISALGVDSASFSAHKFQGPRGVGLLYQRAPRMQALSRGGNQERGLRPGTENLAAIAAMSIALQESLATLDKNLAHYRQLRTLLEAELSSEKQIRLLSHSEHSISSILALSIDNLPAEVAVRSLSDQGFSLSSGSACSANKAQEQNNFFTRLAYTPQEAQGALRISFGPTTSVNECTDLTQALRTLAVEHANFRGR